jgi:RNA polymerase sigma-70 factor (ECF subfamily)
MSAAEPLDPATEAALLARVKKGGAERVYAFDDLFAAMRRQVFGVCVHVTGNADDAEDALQETFFAVHVALPDFRGESRLSTWVHRIAIRTAFRVRSRRRAAGRVAGADVHDVDPPARGPDPVLAGELALRLSAAMDRLPAEHRVVISLFAVDGLAHAQIADILGVPEGTVWSRLHAARKRLAKELGDAVPTSPASR